VNRASAWRRHDAEDRRFFNGKGKNPETVIKNRNEENLENLFAILDFICDKNTWFKSLKRLSTRI
jgi:hypothetical protein